MRRIIPLLIVLFFQIVAYPQETTVHKYRLIVKDVNGNLFNQKQINYSIISDIFNSKKVIHGQAFTSENGEALITAVIPIEWDLSRNEFLNKLNKGRPHFTSIFVYEINDSIHYTAVGSLKSYRGGAAIYSPDYYESLQEWDDLTTKEYQERVIILALRDDYFSNHFSSLKEAKKYKYDLEKLLDFLIVNKVPKDLYLRYKSTSIEQFKAKSFFSLAFECNDIYNSYKLDEHDIIKKLLNENIYSLIKDSNEFLSFQKNKLGLKINVVFYSRNFLNDNSAIKKSEVVYYFFNDILKKYLLKDISRQDLLAKSIILLNEDKIDIN